MFAKYYIETQQLFSVVVRVVAKNTVGRGLDSRSDWTFVFVHPSLHGEHAYAQQ